MRLWLYTFVGNYQVFFSLPYQRGTFYTIQLLIGLGSKVPWQSPTKEGEKEGEKKTLEAIAWTQETKHL